MGRAEYRFFREFEEKMALTGSTRSRILKKRIVGFFSVCPKGTLMTITEKISATGKDEELEDIRDIIAARGVTECDVDEAVSWARSSS